MTRFDHVYSAMLCIFDKLGVQPAGPRRREIEDLLRALDQEAHQRGFDAARYLPRAFEDE
jgi:hypothetical protein